jgi:hypothetical protein
MKVVEPTVPLEQKKRGRKPAATQPQLDKGSRPPLARNALVYDTVTNVRRSNREKK